MKHLILLSVAAALILLSACQPRTALKTADTAPADSVLYFQQTDLNDPFLDTIFQQPDTPVQLETQLLPPPAPPAVPPRFKEIEGFRIQIFAGIDSVNALPVLDEAVSLTGDSVYFFQDKGLFKIQTGDYQFRYQADSARTFFRQNGFPGAWVVQRPILIPVAPDSLAASPAAAGPAGLIGGAAGRFKIQLMAIADPEKARLTAAALQSDNGYNAFYEQSGSLYKLFVGYFDSENQAREVLQDLRENGYPDAWLVY